MVSTKEDMVNFDKLENEVLKAMNADAKYQRENDAKFRAVDQKVASYDEFRDIVMASHLKPLEKDEKIEKLSDRFYQKWNVCAGNKEEKPAASTIAPQGERRLPRTSVEFGREWRHYKTPAAQYGLLLRLGGEGVGRVMGRGEIAMGVLGEAVAALDNQYRQEDGAAVLAILRAFSHVPRFSLSRQFLSTTEVTQCTQLFSKLSQSLGHTQVQDVMHAYDVTQ